MAPSGMQSEFVKQQQFALLRLYSARTSSIASDAALATIKILFELMMVCQQGALWMSALAYQLCLIMIKVYYFLQTLQPKPSFGVAHSDSSAASGVSSSHLLK